MIAGRVVAVVAGLALLCGCSSVVEGKAVGGAASGSELPSASGTHDFPSPSGSGSRAAPSASAPSAPASSGTSPATASLRCPTVSVPAARLTFTCIDNTMTSTSGVLWPVQLIKPVESTGWALEEGLAHPGSPAGNSLAQVAAAYRTKMVEGGNYLPNPKIATVSNKSTEVDGAPAHLLQTMVTLNTAQAAKRGTKVRQEQLWILAIQAGADDVTVWHVSVPDLVKSLWPKVPGVISSIKVG